MEGKMRIHATQALERIRALDARSYATQAVEQTRALKLPSVPALALYLATVLTEIPVIFTRMLIAMVVVVLGLLISGNHVGDANRFLDLGLIPTAWAALALISPLGGGWWWRQNLGGRRPTPEERVACEEAFASLSERAVRPLSRPASWFVLDYPELDAAVCGSSLMLSRGLIESEYLPAVLAHELGHLATSDGKLTAALNRLVIHPPPLVEERDDVVHRPRVVPEDRFTFGLFGVQALWRLIRFAVRFAKGGLALRLLGPFWGSYWREREYLADAYAASLGQGERLAFFLEVHALVHDHPVPFIWLTEHTHPPVALRVAKLRALAKQLRAAMPQPALSAGES
jgi:Zn-dependent protease with chaperone function